MVSEEVRKFSMTQFLDKLNIRDLSIEERIQLVGEIWDSIAEEKMPGLTEYEKEVLDERMRTFDVALERGITWEEIVEGVRPKGSDEDIPMI